MKIHLLSKYNKARTFIIIIEECEPHKTDLSKSKVAFPKIEPIIKTPKEPKNHMPNKINGFFTRVFQRKNQGVG